MRFFATGSLHSKRGPRAILAAALGMLLLFTIAYALRESFHLGWSVESIRQELHRAAGLDWPTPVVLLETLHIDLLLFSFMLLFLGALIYHLPFSSRKKGTIFIALGLIIILYPLSKVLTYFYAIFAILTLGAAILLYLYLGFVILLLLLFLFAVKDENEEIP